MKPSTLTEYDRAGLKRLWLKATSRVLMGPAGFMGIAAVPSSISAKTTRHELKTTLGPRSR